VFLLLKNRSVGFYHPNHARRSRAHYNCLRSRRDLM
jgi:hypothetical protein